LAPKERARMAFHHVAIATRDLRKNHAFYTEAMGFRLVKVEPGKTESGGWMKHLFYDTGGDGMIAFWDIHDDTIPEDFATGISTGLGLPPWVNHLAWKAEDLEDIARKRDRWLACGHDVVEIDHYWCVSIYTHDPNGILVEWCTTTKPFDAEDERRALELLEDPQPELVPPPRVKVHRAEAAGNG
jgi:catechol 2,3-dioxygenase-like lactoylglutathione lyase family enzyme